MRRIESFLSLYDSPGTVRNYKILIKSYLDLFYGKDLLDDQVERYFSEPRDYEEDAKVFYVTIKSRPPKSVQVLMSMLRTFLLENDVEINAKFWKSLRRKKKGTRARTQDRVPTKEELRRIVMQLPIDGKVLFLVLASSGMRIGEALKLKTEDIDMAGNPVAIRIRGEYTKSGNQRLTFCSGEAKEALTEWLKVRQAYIKRYRKKDDGRLFPMSYENADKIWVKALVKTDLFVKDPQTKWNLLHIHTLRKFFRTQLATKIPVDVVEMLIGHTSYLSDEYRRYSEAQLSEMYKKGMSSISIYGASEEASKDLEDLKLENARMRLEINELQTLKAKWEKFTEESNDLFEWMRAAKESGSRETFAHLAMGHEPIPQAQDSARET